MDENELGMNVGYEADYQKQKSFSIKQKNQDGIQILLNLCGIFGHSKFFTDKLWKKVKGFKNADEAEILNYFMIAELYSKGLYYSGIGMSWGSPCDKETCEQYLSKFEAIGKAYKDWCISQR